MIKMKLIILSLLILTINFSGCTFYVLYLGQDNGSDITFKENNVTEISLNIEKAYIINENNKRLLICIKGKDKEHKNITFLNNLEINDINGTIQSRSLVVKSCEIDKEDYEIKRIFGYKYNSEKKVFSNIQVYKDGEKIKSYPNLNIKENKVIYTWEIGKNKGLALDITKSIKQSTVETLIETKRGGLYTGAYFLLPFTITGDIILSPVYLTFWGSKQLVDAIHTDKRYIK